MNPLSRFLRNLGLSLLALLALDFAIGRFLSPSYRLQGGSLERYFGYGFSLQNKLERMVGANDSDAHPLATAGWNTSLPVRVPAREPDCETRYTFYGMSFSNRIANALAEQDPCASIRLVAGPGAPLSHSYSEYQRLHDQDDAEIVVLGVLASSLAKNLSTAHFNSAFEAPGAHMYPRYRWLNGELVETMPPAKSLDEFRTLLNSDVERLKTFLSAHDEYYSPLVFAYPQFDKSIVVRMLRRAYGQSFKRNLLDDFRTSDGRFTNKNNLLDISLAILGGAARTAEQDDVRFIVFLINDQGFTESLDDAFARDLSARDVLFLSSTSIIDARNVSNFLPDGHFQPTLDQELANALSRFLSH